MTRGRPVLVIAGLLATATFVVVASAVVSSAGEGAAPAPEPAPATATVERGTLAASVSLRGTLTYRARPDGSPYVAVNRAGGTYTTLPGVGDAVGCGEVLYRVDDRPVLLLCGVIPAYRDLRVGEAGNDVRQLNAELHALGIDAAAGIDLGADDEVFTDRTAIALARLQQERGADATGELGADGAIFLPEGVRIAEVVGDLGGPAPPGAPVLRATSDVLEVQVVLEGSQQGAVTSGDRAEIRLPANTTIAGTVDRLATIARAPAGPDASAASGSATILASVRLDDPGDVRGLDQAPVQVSVTTEGIEDVLNVPVTAVVGRAGGGYAVEVVGDDERRELVAVELGLFDGSAARVQVDGDLHVGDLVVVPSS